MLLKGAIAAGSRQAADAGRELFMMGGNAVDAALAATFASFVSEMMISSIGGGGFAIIDTPSQDVPLAYDFYCNVPGKGSNSEINIDELDFEKVAVLFEDIEDYEYVGRGSTAVPGNIAGLVKLSNDFGSVPLTKIVQPALQLARDGFRLSTHQEKLIWLSQFILRFSEPCFEIFSINGELLKQNGVLRAPDLANTFEMIAQAGTKPFYEGIYADELVEDHKNHGGLITQEDLTSYVVNVSSALKYYTASGLQVYTVHPPSIGGQVLTTLFEEKGGVNQTIAKVDQLQKKAIQDFLKSVKNKSNKYKLNPSNNTTHISAIDSDNQCVSITVSSGASAGYMLGRTGILLNNILGEPQLNINGYHTLESGHRMMSMMTPCIVKDGSGAILAIGGGGASRIPSSIYQVINNIFLEQMDLSQAVESPRIHYEDGILEFEDYHRNRYASSMTAANPKEIRKWSQKSMYFGGTHAVMRNTDNFAAHGDSRRGGYSHIIL